MRRWHERPIEEASLFNPGFCSLVCWSTSVGHHAANAQGMPLELFFLATPVVLHKRTRDSLPGTIRTSMAAWMIENASARVGFADRARAVGAYVREGLLFGSVYGLLEFRDSGLVVPGPKPRGLAAYLRDATPEVKECMKKAEFVGKWLAGAGTPPTIMALWGVRP